VGGDRRRRTCLEEAFELAPVNSPFSLTDSVRTGSDGEEETLVIVGREGLEIWERRSEVG